MLTGDVVETARELEVEPEDVAQMLPSHDKILTDEDCFLWVSKENDFWR